MSCDTEVVLTCETEAELWKNWPINRENIIMNKYGVSMHKYIRMHVAQGGLCDICHHHARSKRNEMQRFLCIDHWYFN